MLNVMNKNKEKNNFLFPMVIMSILFFMVGFITTMNNSLIDFLSSSKWMLSFSEKQLVNTAFFGAYLFSIPLSYLLNKLGYKASAVLSLFVVGVGFILTYPAVSMGYVPFLISMFLVASGIALLQIVLNPYVLALGSPNEAASRLNLVGFFNSAATVAAPIFVTMLISAETISETAPVESRPDATNVQMPFLIIAGIAFILCLLLYFLHLPEIKEEPADKAHSSSSPYKYPHLIFGAIAIFVYMGVEIGIPSFLPDRMRALGIDSVNLLGYELKGTGVLSIYWGGLMVGRLFGSILLRKIKVRTAMVFCSGMAMLFLIVSLLINNEASIILMLLCGFCNSIMWGSIFNLASEDLGEHTKRASGIICTFAIGGAILPPLMGALQQSFGTDALTIGTSAALSCLIIYYLYLILFTVKLSRIRPHKK
ncbi:glucose/galactose MFS transporter [Bacteroides intestinalis]|uniref:Glucose/galactose MFS transporter n=2 Tax=Bacteroides intestinalis TaxID=329854 RepID=A0A412YBE1_9BACE|nr:glucose/galactose MFS transporter [Bacteroides intestinalis]RHA62879.1 glucose/galactose MFS transporter [Bacteroides intestinalis]